MGSFCESLVSRRNSCPAARILRSSGRKSKMQRVRRSPSMMIVPTIIRAGSGSEEELIPDPRGGVSPAEWVDRNFSFSYTADAQTDPALIRH